MRFLKKKIVWVIIFLFSFTGIMTVYEFYASMLIGNSEPADSLTYADYEKIPILNSSSLLADNRCILNKVILLKLKFQIPFVFLDNPKVKIEDLNILNNDSCATSIYRGMFNEQKPIELHGFVINKNSSLLKIRIYLRTKKRMWAWTTDEIEISKNTKYEIILFRDDFGDNRAMVKPIK